ncbi:MAG TPA: 4-hydroxybenzoate octaprenyltransferase [Alphaproteobacteria bacterium]|nr:4-hydroxybenzoate octaprenyltransferase [Alphaproteobacteria bacterium]
MPSALHPYARLARLDRPIGTWLLLLPCWWGLALGLGQPGTGVGHAVWLAVLLTVGAFAMRGAGCTYNDIVDRNFDARVARTALRPIPSGEVTVRQAWVFLALQLAIGAAVLFSLNVTAIVVGILSVPIVAAYPFAKRVTHWPQAVLGLAFNWGVLVAYAALTGGLSWAAVLVYLGGCCWTLGYDTVYAHQDKEDDAMIGVKSTALLFRERTKPWLALFYGTMLALLAAGGVNAGVGLGFWIGLLAAAVHLGWQILSLRLDDPDDCLRKFKANRDAGLLVTGALLLGGV